MIVLDVVVHVNEHLFDSVAFGEQESLFGKSGLILFFEIEQRWGRVDDIPQLGEGVDDIIHFAQLYLLLCLLIDYFFFFVLDWTAP